MASGASAAFREHVYQPATKAGDVVLWSEATIHGATPWRGAHQRRLALYRFAPANMGYGRGYLEHPQAQLQQMSPMQRAVLEPPYSPGAQRPILEDNGELSEQSKEQLAEVGWDGIGNNERGAASNPPKPGRPEPTVEQRGPAPKPPAQSAAKL